MKAKDILAVLVFSAGWGALLFSIALFLLFWRVDNEPGAQDIPELLQAGVLCLSAGGPAFLGGNAYFLLKKAWKAYLVALGVGAAMLLLAVLVSPMLLILLV